MFSDSSSFPGETYVFMKVREGEGRVYRSGLVLKWRSGGMCMIMNSEPYRRRLRLWRSLSGVLMNRTAGSWLLLTGMYREPYCDIRLLSCEAAGSWAWR